MEIQTPLGIHCFKFYLEEMIDTFEDKNKLHRLYLVNPYEIVVLNDILSFIDLGHRVMK